MKFYITMTTSCMAAITAQLYYLQDHFDSEDTGEHIVEVVEDEVTERIQFKDWIFGGQRYTAGTDDDHDEQVEVSKIDDKVTKPTNAANPMITLYCTLEVF